MPGQTEVIMAGFGGQGVMTAGQLLAYTAMEEGKQVCWIPSYGPEMRGGTANCTVVISDSRIGSPIINSTYSACVFNRPSLDKFGPIVRKDGLLLINSSLIDVTSGRGDLKEYLIPVNDLAIKLGSPKVANIVMLAAYVELTGVVSFDTLGKMLQKKMGHKQELLEINRRALAMGREYIRRAAA